MTDPPCAPAERRPRGRGGRSHIGTLVERHSRYVVLLRLPSSRTDDVIEILTAAVADLPDELRGSLTWDQGNEMTKHALFTRATGVPVYYCEPRSPWQRGSNENTNGPPAPVLPEEHRPVGPHRRRPRLGSVGAEQPASQGPGMEASRVAMTA